MNWSIRLTSRDRQHQHDLVDPTIHANQIVWETASQSIYVNTTTSRRRQRAVCRSSILNASCLRYVLEHSPEVVHLQSGHGLDDVALVYTSAKSVIGVDYGALRNP